MIKMFSVGDIKEFEFEGAAISTGKLCRSIGQFKRKLILLNSCWKALYQLFFQRKDNLYFVVVNKDTSYLLYDNIMTPLGGLIDRGNYQSLLFSLAVNVQRSAILRRMSIFRRRDLSFFVFGNVTGIRKIRLCTTQNRKHKRILFYRRALCNGINERTYQCRPWDNL